MRVPRALTIAGSDSGGGAGIQADLRTFYALGVFGMTAVTAVTVQNTRGVQAVDNLPPATVTAQIEAVAMDLGPDAVKTGMLGSGAVVEAVAAAVDRLGLGENLVVDPVLAAGGGERLLDDAGLEALRRRLIPLAHVVTPNVPEAEALTGITIANERDLGAAARRIHALGARWVIIKGGHLPFGEEAVDYLYDGAEFIEVVGERLAVSGIHGAGCTYAAALAAGLARGEDIPAAARLAKDYVTAAIRHRLDMGGGRSPVNHWGNRWFAYGRTSM